MARYAKGYKLESRARIVDAAGRGFRKQGYGGIGVDGLAREAGVTHGAFYGHFSSKAEAFGAAVIAGLQELREGIRALQVEHGTGWLAVFAAFYMGHKRTCELAEMCTLPSLSVEIERAEAPVRTAYEGEVRLLMSCIAAGLPQGTPAEREARAWVILSLLAGGVTLARAVPGEATSAEIAVAVQAAVMSVAKSEAV